jgi:hypothetical protein
VKSVVVVDFRAGWITPSIRGYLDVIARRLRSRTFADVHDLALVGVELD